MGIIGKLFCKHDQKKAVCSKIGYVGSSCVKCGKVKMSKCRLRHAKMSSNAFPNNMKEVFCFSTHDFLFRIAIYECIECGARSTSSRLNSVWNHQDALCKDLSYYGNQFMNGHINLMDLKVSVLDSYERYITEESSKERKEDGRKYLEKIREKYLKEQ